ncbi:MAG TPA: NAD-dependent epimerase/dehydratase family protein [Candidatus Udaeobacter sp.]|jgi:nucleoside-diphosphate-sugar epimerase|nr:NAD-dependent epimerase/dehydratase family protein [Candidatus Udaeobacter sp.]
MPRILIAGCGYVGQAAADLFRAKSWSVEGWTRSAQSAALLSGKAYAVRTVNISERAEVADCARAAGEFDAVVHCASSGGGDEELYRQVYLIGMRNLLEIFPRSKLLFTSSTSVYAQRDESWVTEESETKPMREPSRILLEAERLVLDSGGIVARIAGIYGPGRSALLTKFLNGTATLDPQNDRFVNQVHRDDIVLALFLLLNQEVEGNQIYNVVDDEPILRSACYRWLAQTLNRPIPPIGKSPQPRKRGESNKRVCNAKLRRLGWTPQYSTFAKGMEKSVLPSFAEVLHASH